MLPTDIDTILKDDRKENRRRCKFKDLTLQDLTMTDVIEVTDDLSAAATLMNNSLSKRATSGEVMRRLTCLQLMSHSTSVRRSSIS